MIWQDKIVEHPRTFAVQNNADGTITLIPVPGTIVQAGTPVNAANLNGVEKEINNILDDIVVTPASNKVPRAGTDGKLNIGWIPDFEHSFGTSGYQKLPGGLIIQWGISGGNGVYSGTVLFPIAFPNSCFMVTHSYKWEYDGESNHATNAFNISKSSFQFHNDGYPFSWIALGC